MKCPECDATFLSAAVFGTDEECPFCGAEVGDDE